MDSSEGKRFHNYLHIPDHLFMILFMNTRKSSVHRETALIIALDGFWG